MCRCGWACHANLLMTESYVCLQHCMQNQLKKRPLRTQELAEFKQNQKHYQIIHRRVPSALDITSRSLIQNKS